MYFKQNLEVQAGNQTNKSCFLLYQKKTFTDERVVIRQIILTRTFVSEEVAEAGLALLFREGLA